MCNGRGGRPDPDLPHLHDVDAELLCADQECNQLALVRVLGDLDPLILPTRFRTVERERAQVRCARGAQNSCHSSASLALTGAPFATSFFVETVLDGTVGLALARTTVDLVCAIC